jgi:hypothetical protein
MRENGQHFVETTPMTPDGSSNAAIPNFSDEIQNQALIFNKMEK